MPTSGYHSDPSHQPPWPGGLQTASFVVSGLHSWVSPQVFFTWAARVSKTVSPIKLLSCLKFSPNSSPWLRERGPHHFSSLCTFHTPSPQAVPPCSFMPPGPWPCSWLCLEHRSPDCLALLTWGLSSKVTFSSWVVDSLPPLCCLASWSYPHHLYPVLFFYNTCHYLKWSYLLHVTVFFQLAGLCRVQAGNSLICLPPPS